MARAIPVSRRVRRIDVLCYSLRQSFKDRLIAAQAPDSSIDGFMGQRTGKPTYGDGPSLELKLKSRSL
jgi:hypothetical protein